MNVRDIIIYGILAIFTLFILVYLIVNQRRKVLNWLRYAVSEAEKMLGSGTGQLKLHEVYDWFCDKFHIISSVIPFWIFSKWVDIALDTLNDWMNSNDNIEQYIATGRAKASTRKTS